MLLLGGLPFEAFSQSLFVRDSGVGEGERALVPRLLHVYCHRGEKLQASPFVQYPFAFHWQQSPCSLSTLTNFSLLLLFAGVPVAGLSFVASIASPHDLIHEFLHHGFCSLVVWLHVFWKNIQGIQRQHCLELIRILSDGISWIDNRTSSHIASKTRTPSPRKGIPIRSQKARRVSGVSVTRKYS